MNTSPVLIGEPVNQNNDNELIAPTKKVDVEAKKSESCC